MASGIQWDATVQQDLASRGITESTGVYGQHKVKLGKSSPIRLDEIKSAGIPFAGFKKATKVARGKAGIANSAESALKTLYSRTGTLDAKSLLGTLKAMQTQTDRLAKLGQLTQAQKQDTMWTFTSAVQSLSNRELSAAYQSFLSGEMDLLQTALMREGHINPRASDARRAAAQLFDLQALILKEISNRSVNEQLDQVIGGQGQVVDGVVYTLDDINIIDGVEQILPDKDLDDGSPRPKTLTQQFGAAQQAGRHAEAHDITAANLVSLTEVGAQSATTREKTAITEQSKLSARGIDGVTVKEMGDALRRCEVTMNIKTEYLIGGANSIFDHPNDPMVNIYHLHDQGVDPKGAGYLDERSATEDVLFPEFKGRKVNADERPMYAAINYRRNPIAAITTNSDYGASSIVLKPEAAKRATYTVNDTFFSTRLNVSQERRRNFYSLLDGVNSGDHLRFGGKIPESLVQALKNPDSQEHKDFEALLDKIDADPEWQMAANLKLNKFSQAIKDHFPVEQEAQSDAFSPFKAFLTECFADAEATRGAMATHDNLETLVTQMHSVTGNNLAYAVQANASGESQKFALERVQYIEAQIHGPLIPSRDIAEIRINLDDVPKDEQEALKARARAYEKDTGIKVTFVGYDMEYDANLALDSVVNDQMQFNAQHIDRAALESARQGYLDRLDEWIGFYIQDNPIALANGLPPEALRLDDNDKAKLREAFATDITNFASAPNNDSAEDIVKKAFEKNVMNILRRKSLQNARQDYLARMEDKVRDYVKSHPELTQGLPEGMLRLEGNALAKMTGKFASALNDVAERTDPYHVLEEITSAFANAARPVLEQKAALLRELEAIASEEPPMTAAQKEAVAKWVVAAKALGSPAELRTILKHARVQEALFKEIAAADPPMTAAQAMQRIADMAMDLDKDLAELKKSFDADYFGPDHVYTEQDRVGFMSLALLQNAEPPLDQAGIKKLRDCMAGQEMRTIIGQLMAVEDDPA
ncbi:MAG: hypothetical protein J6I40_00800, partial [Mailhella sp.]|nr:hypothetical protein [Mailhella sp.]